jgi:hypothetical protein
MTISWNQVIMTRFHYARYCTSLEVGDYWHNRSESGHGARVALRTHPFYTRTRTHTQHHNEKK